MHWHKALSRRSQRTRIDWTRMNRLSADHRFEQAGRGADQGVLAAISQWQTWTLAIAGSIAAR